MIPAHSGGLLAAEVVKAVREGDLDAVTSWLAAGGDEFVNEPARYEYRCPLGKAPLSAERIGQNMLEAAACAV